MKYLQLIFAPNTTSEQWKLNVRDFLRGLFIAALTVPVDIVLRTMEAGHFTFDWATIKHSAIVGVTAYLVKNFMTPAPPKTPS